MRNWFVVLAAVACCASAPRAAGAAIRYVSTTGSDGTNDCLTSTMPCQSLTHAENAAAAGDEVEMTAGLYALDFTEQIFSVALISGGWLPGFGSRDPKRHPTRHGRLSIINSSTTPYDVTLDGIDIRGHRRATEGIDVSGPVDLTIDGCVLTTAGIQLFEGANLTVVGSTLTRSHGAAIVIGGSSGSSTLAVRNSQFQDDEGAILVVTSNSGSAASLSVDASVFERNMPGGSSALEIDNDAGSVTAEVTNSVLARNATQPFPAFGIDGSGAAVKVVGDGASTTVSLVNDTIVDNQAKAKGGTSGVGGGVFVTGNASMTLTNDILWGNRSGASSDDVTVAGGAVVDADHDDLGSAHGTLVDLGGNVALEPELVADIHLRSTSPMIDAGTCTGAPPTDIDGDPRPSGAGCDIGADEFVP